MLALAGLAGYRYGGMSHAADTPDQVLLTQPVAAGRPEPQRILGLANFMAPRLQRTSAGVVDDPRAVHTKHHSRRPSAKVGVRHPDADHAILARQHIYLLAHHPRPQLTVPKYNEIIRKYSPIKDNELVACTLSMRYPDLERIAQHYARPDKRPLGDVLGFLGM
ncbi:hypothetical protein B0H17DRAFT_1138799 [Mycena rosella]|uniref:Uncharacterized protein n=1 Tax=Mycena rosella TaxID=1033263 RepID=A0AAD7D5J5_MYCRO|nr:hypothetical protein B0H17DRAFT_1138799 [Mycena rosella]